MIVLALLLAALGTADLLAARDSLHRGRASGGKRDSGRVQGSGKKRDSTAKRDSELTARRAAVVGRGLIAAVIVVALGAWGAGVAWWWAAGILVVTVAWLVSTMPSTHTDARARTYPWPLIGLAVMILATLATTPVIAEPSGWLPDWFATLDPPTASAHDAAAFTRFALIVGCVLVLIETANIAVRLVLATSVSGIAKAEQELKGGRILGPIERVFIFAMALSGEYLAVSAVIAAKSILRFPEVSREGGHGSRAEYVLVGSFVSWGIALLFVPLL